ncbi:MAG TPA: urease accessory protein UreF [Gammaproteobacteria bacterium]|nr:urease accessory protein UreF [Gammaproteobacteria bacterium]
MKSDQDGCVFSRIMCLPRCAVLGVLWSRKSINPFIQRAVLMGSTPSIIIMTDTGALIQAMHLFSPSLPIGAFAFSQGLEAAIESGRVLDSETLTEWCRGVMCHSLSSLDGYYARLAYRAVSQSQFVEMNAELLASRETRELLLEDTLLGSALKKWAVDQAIDVPDATEYSLICLYGWIASRLDIPEDWMVASILWAWLDNQMVVAAKAIPLGQNALQGVLKTLKPLVADCVQQSCLATGTVAHSTVPLLTILSAQHETQYSRLFRS